MNEVKILHDPEVRADPGVLDAAWTQDGTFAVLSERSGVDRNWVESCLGRLDPDLRIGHFGLLSTGSTGRPKLVIGNRQRAEGLARVLHDVQDSESVRSTVLSLPLSYCYAFVNQWLWSVVMRREFVVTAGLKSPESFAQALRNADRASLCLVGAQIPLLAALLPDDRFPGIIRLNFAGGPFPQAHLAQVRRLFPEAQVFNNYGCTEAMRRLTVRRLRRAMSPRTLGGRFQA